MNRERFATGNVRKVSVSKVGPETNHIDRKHIEKLGAKFEQGTQNQTTEIVAKPERMVGKLNTKNLFNDSSEKEDGKAVNGHVKVGKIDTKTLFVEEEKIEDQQERRPIGKLDTKILFENNVSQEDNCESPKPEVKVGKLKSTIFEPQNSPLQSSASESHAFKYPESETTRTVIKVGKLNTANVFESQANEVQKVQKEEIKGGKL